MAKLIDPATVVSKSVYRKALTQVNKIRVKGGFPALTELPRGEQRAACNCPIRRALKDIGVSMVDGDEIAIKVKHPLGITEATFPAGVAISDFITEFDAVNMEEPSSGFANSYYHW